MHRRIPIIPWNLLDNWRRQPVHPLKYEYYISNLLRTLIYNGPSKVVQEKDTGVPKYQDYWTVRSVLKALKINECILFFHCFFEIVLVLYLRFAELAKVPATECLWI